MYIGINAADEFSCRHAKKTVLCSQLQRDLFTLDKIAHCAIPQLVSDLGISVPLSALKLFSFDFLSGLSIMDNQRTQTQNIERRGEKKR